jgi:hypothetical protein
MTNTCFKRNAACNPDALDKSFQHRVKNLRQIEAAYNNATIANGDSWWRERR